MNQRLQVFLPFLKCTMLLLSLLLMLVASTSDEQPEPLSYQPPVDEERIAEVVKKAQKGDAASFTTLYHWYYTQVYRHLVRMVGYHEDAADLAAETFTKAWWGLPGLYDERRFRSWLYSIATHAALDHIRRKKSHEPFWEGPIEDHTDEGAARFEGRVEEQELVRLALMRVAPKPRSCLLLHVEGFSQDEIAKLLGLSRKSVGTYVSIAREQFRQAYHRLENA